MSTQFYKNKSSKGSIYFVAKNNDLGTSHFVSFGVDAANQPVLVFTAMTDKETGAKQGEDYVHTINLG